MDGARPRSRRIASFHLVRERSGRAPLAMARLATDRRRLPAVPGLTFWRVLGTGRGDDTAPSVDARRTALFAVWREEEDLDRFLAGSPLAERWVDAEEAWHVRLLGLGGHGTWRGIDVLAAVDRGQGGGRLAVVTRAAVRPGAHRRFRSAGRPVSDEVRAADGLLDVVGFGEAPVARLGTFSLWRDAEAVRRFLVTAPAHGDVVRRTRRERWYGEELFARFEPYASAGTWDGRDPLAAGDQPGRRGTSIP